MDKLSNILNKHQSQTSKQLHSQVIKKIGDYSKFEVYYKSKILEIGKSMFTNFEIIKGSDRANIYSELLKYFIGENCIFDLNKGIYLYGEYGIGKTVTMSILSKFLATFFPFSPNGFGITSIEKIAEYYKANGNMTKYGRYVEINQVNNGDRTINEVRNKSFHICINEFGKELKEKHYGTEIQNIFNSMMMVRYEMFQEGKVLTHATSNFHPSELSCFDSALLDRFNEMFNFIEMKGNSLRL